MGIKLLLLGAVLSVVDVAAGDRFGPVGADRFERQAPASAVDATPDYDSYYAIDSNGCENQRLVIQHTSACDPSNPALFKAVQCGTDEGASWWSCSCADPVTGATLEGTSSSGWASNDLIVCEPELFIARFRFWEPPATLAHEEYAPLDKPFNPTDDRPAARNYLKLEKAITHALLTEFNSSERVGLQRVRVTSIDIATLLAPANRQPRRTFAVTAEVASIGHRSAFAETDALVLQANVSEHVRQQLGIGRVQTAHGARNSLPVRTFLSAPRPTFAPSLTRSAQQPSRAVFVADFFPEFAQLWLTTNVPTTTRTTTTRRTSPMRRPADKPPTPAVPNPNLHPNPSISDSGSGSAGGSSASLQDPAIGELIGNTDPNSPPLANTTNDHSARFNQSLSKPVSPSDKSLFRHYTDTGILFSNPAVIAGGIAAAIVVLFGLMIGALYLTSRLRGKHDAGSYVLEQQASGQKLRLPSNAQAVLDGAMLNVVSAATSSGGLASHRGSIHSTCLVNGTRSPKAVYSPVPGPHVPLGSSVSAGPIPTVREFYA